MRRRRLFAAVGVIVLVAVVSLGGWVTGFFYGVTYALTRDAQTDAGITAHALRRLRGGRLDEGIQILEADLRGDFVSHWGGFQYEDSAPHIWLPQIFLSGPLTLSGISSAASYLTDHPDPSGGDLDRLVNRIAGCFTQPNLPDPRGDKLAHRKAIRACYDEIQ